MTISELIQVIREAHETGRPVGVILGTSGPHRATWAQICVAEMMRQGWITQAVDVHPKTTLVAACALVDFLPPILRQPTAAKGPAIYVLAEESLPSFNITGTWIGAGLTDSHLLPKGVIWVRHFNEPVPKGAIAIEGYDAESFFACLLEGLGEFPPKEFLPTATRPRYVTIDSRTPAEQLGMLLRNWEELLRQKSLELHRGIVSSWPQVKPVPDAEDWARRLEDAADLATRLDGAGAAGSFALLMEALADYRTPRVADGFLGRAEQIQRSGSGHSDANRPLYEFMLPPLLVRRAKLRTERDADPLYAEADALLSRAKPGTGAGEVSRLKDQAKLLADWSAATSDPVKSRILFETSLEKLEQALLVPVDYWSRSSCEITIRGTYLELLGRRASKTSVPSTYFASARGHAQQLIASKESWRGYFGVGVIEILESKQQSERFLRQAIELAPVDQVALLTDWGVALMGAGMLAEAFVKFEEASGADKAAFIPLLNMSAVRLRQARGGEPTLKEAVEYAERAELVKPGAGAYQLACAAGQRADRVGVEWWMTVAAEAGFLQSPDSVRNDPDFQSIATESWFDDLLRGLYPDSASNSGGN